MPHNKNTDKVVKRILPWIILLGFIGLIIYIFMPNVTTPNVNYSNPTSQDIDSYLSSPNVALENDPFYDQLNLIKENLRYVEQNASKSTDPEHSQVSDNGIEKPQVSSPVVPYQPNTSDHSMLNEAIVNTDDTTNPSMDEITNNDKQATSVTPTDSQATTVDADKTVTNPNLAQQDDDADNADNTDLTKTTASQQNSIVADNTQETEDNHTDKPDETKQAQKPPQSSGEFVKHLAIYEQQENYWQYIKNNQENKTLVQQLEPMRKLLSRSALTKVEILYTDYVKDGNSKPENSKIIAVRGIEKEKTWIYFARFDSDQIFYYDYDGNTPEPSMDRVPLNYTRITSPFNPNRRHPITGRIRPHDGVDLKAPYGAPVHSTGNGIVSFAGWQHGYGRLVIVKHPNGYETRYAHMSAINVAVGDSIKRGAVVGKVGNSGISTGHHLHFEVRVDGVPQNPMTVALPSFKPINRDYMDIWHFRAEQYQVVMKELTKSGYSLN